MLTHQTYLHSNYKRLRKPYILLITWACPLPRFLPKPENPEGLEGLGLGVPIWVVYYIVLWGLGFSVPGFRV